MKEFLTTERIDPAKRLVVERTKDFGEIYDVFNLGDASTLFFLNISLTPKAYSSSNFT